MWLRLLSLETPGKAVMERIGYLCLQEARPKYEGLWQLGSLHTLIKTASQRARHNSAAKGSPQAERWGRKITDNRDIWKSVDDKPRLCHRF